MKSGTKEHSNTEEKAFQTLPKVVIKHFLQFCEEKTLCKFKQTCKWIFDEVQRIGKSRLALLCPDLEQSEEGEKRVDYLFCLLLANKWKLCEEEMEKRKPSIADLKVFKESGSLLVEWKKILINSKLTENRLDEEKSVLFEIEKPLTRIRLNFRVDEDYPGEGFSFYENFELHFEDTSFHCVNHEEGLCEENIPKAPNKLESTAIPSIVEQLEKQAHKLLGEKSGVQELVDFLHVAFNVEFLFKFLSHKDCKVKKSIC